MIRRAKLTHDRGLRARHLICEQLVALAVGTTENDNTRRRGTDPTCARPRKVIAERRNRLMWLTGAALSAVSGLVIIVVVIVQDLSADYAAGLHADATATDGGVGTDGVPSNTGLLIGVALIAAGLVAILIAHLTDPQRGRPSTTPAD